MPGGTLSGTIEEGPRFVMDAAHETCYPEEAFVAAFGDAFVGQVAAALPEGVTPRKAARAIRSMKNPTRHEVILRQAMERLRRSDGVTADAVQRSGGSIVATFAVKP
jgi:hypothetical protein